MDASSSFYAPESDQERSVILPYRGWLHFWALTVAHYPVDAIVEAATLRQYYELESRLPALG
jgi:hypothetical protein